VAVVNQTLVDRYFPGQNPIGRRLEIGFDDPPRWREIVGVVKDVHSAGLDQDTPVQVYTAYFQVTDSVRKSFDSERCWPVLPRIRPRLGHL